MSRSYILIFKSRIIPFFINLFKSLAKRGKKFHNKKVQNGKENVLWQKVDYFQKSMIQAEIPECVLQWVEFWLATLHNSLGDIVTWPHKKRGCHCYYCVARAVFMPKKQPRRPQWPPLMDQFMQLNKVVQTTMGGFPCCK